MPSEQDSTRSPHGVASYYRSHDPEDYTVTEGDDDDLFVKADQTVLLMDRKQARLLADALNGYLDDVDDDPDKGRWYDWILENFIWLRHGILIVGTFFGAILLVVIALAYGPLGDPA